MPAALFDGSIGGGALTLLALSLLVALGFEFVNGFHDTANAVATVIYTRSLKPTPAVILSGGCNFAGVFFGGTAVAMGIIKLLPIELLVSGGIGRSLAMVMSLLLAAVLWNLGTWYFGLPASSSHTMIGAILGVGLSSSAMHGSFGHGVNWSKATEVGASLLVSPLCGMTFSGLLLLALRALIKDKRVFEEAKQDERPPSWIRGLLVTTCSGVSFSHGMNDGQKGVGLIMIILIAVVPAGFALDHHADPESLAAAHRGAIAIVGQLEPNLAGCNPEPGVGQGDPGCEILAESALIARALEGRRAVDDVARDDRWKVRAAILRIDSALKRFGDSAAAGTASVDVIKRARDDIAPLTEYAPTWVLIAVAIALGVGTTVGWKRIVITVGEKIGKTHLTYAQGASAELVAAATILASSYFGLPVSTTHVLSSGIAGTMIVSKSGLQRSTVQNIALAWALTLPVSMLLSGSFYFLFASLLG